MTESSGTPIYSARDARVTPEGIAERTFTQVKRGYAESEVRAFLRMISDEVGLLVGRERDYAARIQNLEARLEQPPGPMSEQDLIAALGEETARVLGQARESAHELRTKAEEHARRVVREAQESARELRSSTQQAVETRAREADEAARARAREIVAEARTLRDRVLSDMNERRADLERQIGELRSNRSALVEMYQVVERTLQQATRTLAQETPLPPPPAVGPLEPSVADDVVSEAPAASGSDGTDAAEEAPEPPPIAESPGDAGATTEPTAPSVPSAAPAPIEATAEIAATEAPSAAATSPTVTTEVTPPPERRDVGALFDQLRSGTTEAQATTAVAVDAPDADTAAAAATDTTAAADAATDTTAAAATEELESLVDELREADAKADEAARAARDDALAPITEDLARRAKRALQDEQNDVLDGLRRQRGKIDPRKVLPPADDQRNRWVRVLQPAVDRAYAAGVAAMAPASADSADSGVPPELATELATSVASPLRDRLETSLASIDARNPADAEIAIAQSLGARYREWRSQGLDDALGDAVALAYARGQYDSAPRGARLRWVPARVGKCPDCDDNALEPTTKGDSFPTGQQYPPAHPGCRCFLVLAPPE